MTPPLCRGCGHNMVSGYCITAKKSENDWLNECEHYDPIVKPTEEKPIKRTSKGQTVLDQSGCCARSIKMCDHWNTCLMPKIIDCSGKSEELEERGCRAKSIIVPESEVKDYFGTIPTFPHIDGNIFVK